VTAPRALEAHLQAASLISVFSSRRRRSLPRGGDDPRDEVAPQPDSPRSSA